MLPSVSSLLTRLLSPPRRPGRAVSLTVTVAMILAAVAAVVAAPAEATACPTGWGSLAKSADRTTTGEITGVRTGRQDCYDRLVVDLNGPAPGYQIEYVDGLVADGSGEPVSVDGGAIIRITVFAPAYDDSGMATIDPAAVNSLPFAGYDTFRDTAWANSFEGNTTIGLGVRARLPFRVFTLAGPGSGSRLVIDVAHSWTSGDSGDPDESLPGTPFDGPAQAGDELAVMGVAYDDELNIRFAPGTDKEVMDTVEPTGDVVAEGRARQLSRSIWYEVTTDDGITGWAGSSFLAFRGSTDDVTSSIVADRGYLTDETLAGLGRQVAEYFASDDPESRIVMSVAPTIGDLGEVTYDVVGLGDDSVAGLRLHVFATDEVGEWWTLRTVEATTFCSRGTTGELCI